MKPVDNLKQTYVAQPDGVLHDNIALTQEESDTFSSIARRYFGEDMINSAIDQLNTSDAMPAQTIDNHPSITKRIKGIGTVAAMRIAQLPSESMAWLTAKGTEHEGQDRQYESRWKKIRRLSSTALKLTGVLAAYSFVRHAASADPIDSAPTTVDLASAPTLITADGTAVDAAPDGHLGYIGGIAQHEGYVPAGSSIDNIDYPASGIETPGDGDTLGGFGNEWAHESVRMGVDETVVAVRLALEKNPGEPITLVGYSQGAIVTSLAIEELDKQGVDISNIHVVSYGNPTQRGGAGWMLTGDIDTGSAQVTNIVNRGDPAGDFSLTRLHEAPAGFLLGHHEYGQDKTYDSVIIDGTEYKVSDEPAAVIRAARSAGIPVGDDDSKLYDILFPPKKPGEAFVSQVDADTLTHYLAEAYLPQKIEAAPLPAEIAQPVAQGVQDAGTLYHDSPVGQAINDTIDDAADRVEQAEASLITDLVQPIASPVVRNVIENATQPLDVQVARFAETTVETAESATLELGQAAQDRVNDLLDNTPRTLFEDIDLPGNR